MLDGNPLGLYCKVDVKGFQTCGRHTIWLPWPLQELAWRHRDHQQMTPSFESEHSMGENQHLLSRLIGILPTVGRKVWEIGPAAHFLTVPCRLWHCWTDWTWPNYNLGFCLYWGIQGQSPIPWWTTFQLTFAQLLIASICITELGKNTKNEGAEKTLDNMDHPRLKGLYC